MSVEALTVLSEVCFALTFNLYGSAADLGSGTANLWGTRHSRATNLRLLVQDPPHVALPRIASDSASRLLALRHNAERVSLGFGMTRSPRPLSPRVQELLVVANGPAVAAYVLDRLYISTDMLFVMTSYLAFQRALHSLVLTVLQRAVALGCTKAASILSAVQALVPPNTSGQPTAVRDCCGVPTVLSEVALRTSPGVENIGSRAFTLLLELVESLPVQVVTKSSG